MAIIKIEKDVPLPNKIRNKVYPLDQMEVNDSFKVDFKKEQSSYSQKQKVYLAIWRYRQSNTNKNFTTVSDKESIRIWRIQ
jgi:hypothetical protein